MKVVLVSLLLLLGLLFPVTEDVTLISTEIRQNRPFAGRINGSVVGTELCVAYWLERGDQPDTVTYRITKPFVFGQLGYIYSKEQLK